MKATYSIFLSSFKPLEDVQLQQIEDALLAQSYDDSQGYGFHNIFLQHKRLSATLINRVATFLPRYDSERGEITEQQAFLFHEVPFALDAQYKLLEIHAPARHASEVKAFLGRVYLDAIFEDAKITPTDILPRLKNANLSINFDNMTVNKFQHRDDVVGRYTIQSLTNEFAEDLLRKYSYDVTKTTLFIESERVGKFRLTLSHTGLLNIRCDDADFDSIFT